VSLPFLTENIKACKLAVAEVPTIFGANVLAKDFGVQEVLVTREISSIFIIRTPLWLP